MGRFLHSVTTFYFDYFNAYTTDICADEASSGCGKLSNETCATGLKTNAKRKPGRPKKIT